MPFVEPEDILYPPPSGWPNITPSRFAPMRKNDTVIDLLAHLPYIANQGRGPRPGKKWYDRAGSTCLWFQTYALNYTDEDFQHDPLDMDRLEIQRLPGADPEYWEPIPAHVAVWTEPEIPTVGHTFLIDTMDGECRDQT